MFTTSFTYSIIFLVFLRLQLLQLLSLGQYYPTNFST